MTPQEPDYVNQCHLCGWPPGQPWLTVAQVAEALNTNKWAVRRMIRSGALDYTKVGRQYRIYHESLDTYIDAHGEMLAGTSRSG